MQFPVRLKDLHPGTAMHRLPRVGKVPAARAAALGA
jgi:hypothetical protein